MTEETDTGDPLAELDAEVDIDGEADPFDDDLFAEEATDTLDEEGVWARLGAADDGATGESTRQSDRGPDGVDEAVVKKRSYCERCEYFSEPPAVSCTHPNTEIVELVDTARFRVRNCPVVARRRNRSIERIAGDSVDSAEESERTDTDE